MFDEASCRGLREASETENTTFTLLSMIQFYAVRSTFLSIFKTYTPSSKTPPFTFPSHKTTPTSYLSNPNAHWSTCLNPLQQLQSLLLFKALAIRFKLYQYAFLKTCSKPAVQCQCNNFHFCEVIALSSSKTTHESSVDTRIFLTQEEFKGDLKVGIPS